MKGVVLDRESFDRGDLNMDALEKALPTWEFHPRTRPDQTAGRLAGAEVVITNKVVLDAALIQGAPNLKLIAVAATGTNNVDLRAAREHGVTVCNVRGYATPSVVQHVFTLLLSLATSLGAYQRAVANGDWARSDQFSLLDYPIAELRNRTIGIVGFGELGRAVSRVAQTGFGMNVLVANRPGEPLHNGRLPLEELLPVVDVLTLHCPLADNTRNLIDRAALARMRPEAILINTARGGIVDESALADALREGRLAGAGVDVLTTEPPKSGNPLLAPDIPNLIVTPHIAWASRESRQRLVDGLAENICAWRKGAPQNVVTG